MLAHWEGKATVPEMSQGKAAFNLLKIQRKGSLGEKYSGGKPSMSYCRPLLHWLQVSLGYLEFRRKKVKSSKWVWA